MNKFIILFMFLLSINSIYSQTGKLIKAGFVIPEGQQHIDIVNQDNNTNKIYYIVSNLLIPITDNVFNLFQLKIDRVEPTSFDGANYRQAITRPGTSSLIAVTKQASASRIIQSNSVINGEYNIIREDSLISGNWSISNFIDYSTLIAYIDTPRYFRIRVSQVIPAPSSDLSDISNYKFIVCVDGEAIVDNLTIGSCIDVYGSKVSIIASLLPPNFGGYTILGSWQSWK